MFTIKFKVEAGENNLIKKSFEDFKEAFNEYVEVLNIPWWEVEISELKIYKGDKDITERINKLIYR